MFKQCLTQQTKIGTMAPCNWYMLNHYLHRLIYNYPNATCALTLHRPKYKQWIFINNYFVSDPVWNLTNQSPTPASDLCLEPYVSNPVSTENYVTT